MAPDSSSNTTRVDSTLGAGAGAGDEGGGEGEAAAARALFASLYADAVHTAGAYVLRECIGQGGMGTVWRAERGDGRFEGQAAVKLLNAGLLGRVGEARFRQEGRILARLEHPNIARLLDAGLSPLGQPYLILEYVVGEHIDAYCDRRGLGVGARLLLFLQVLDAVAHAHANLVVHRDLKPSNVLVTAEGRVKLLDFGIAKMLEGEAGGEAGPSLTREGGQPLTPRYAAPEQFLNGPLGTTTDVYALGVVLAELLSGSPPYRVKTGGLRELEDAIVRHEPLPPSRCVTAAAAEARGAGAARLARRLRGDLDAIVAKALAKAPEARYRSVGAFADDIERHLSDRPVRARAEGRLGRFGRFVRRNRAALGATAGVVVSLSATTGVALRQAQRANAEAAAARRAAARADAAQAFLVDIFAANSAAQPDPARARATTARELLDLGARRIDANLEGDPEAKLRLLTLLGQMYADLGLDDEAVALARRAVALSVAAYGESDLRTARALLSLSSKLYASSSGGERGPVLERAAGVVAALPPGEVGVRAELELEFAEFTRSFDARRSLAHAERAADLYRQGADAEGLGNALRHLAEARYALGRHEGAVEACAESIALLERATRGQSPELTKLYTVIAQSETELGDLARAEEHYRQAAERARRRQGPRHVDVVQTEMRLGTFFSRTEQWPAALTHLELARDVAREIMAPDESFHLPPVLGELGYARALRGDPAAGLPDLRRATELRRASGRGKLFLAQLLANEAFALVELGRYDEAEARLDEADAIQREGGAGPGARAGAAGLRARLLEARGAPDEAARALADADAAAPGQKAPPPLVASAFWLRRGENALARGDLDGAAAEARRVREALPTDERYYGARRARVELLEGGVALARGLPADALPLLRRAHERRLALYHPDALPVAEAHVALARAHLALRRPDEARTLYRRAAAVLRKHDPAPAFYRRPLEALAAALGPGE
jgi:serine/threonine-protein kinase